MRKFVAQFQSSSGEAAALRDSIGELRRLWLDAALQEAEDTPTDLRNPTVTGNDVQRSVRLPFQKNATDAERYRALRGMRITPAVYRDGTLEVNVKDLPGKTIEEKFEKLKELKLTGTKKALKTLATTLGITDQNYRADEIGLDFTYSGRAVGESVQFQDQDRLLGLAKALTVFDDLAKNAVPLNIRDDLYGDKLYPATNTPTEAWYSCISTYVDNGKLIPVKIDIDERKNTENRAHLMITFSEINISGKNEGRELENNGSQLPTASADRKYASLNHVPPLLDYSVADILRNVNSDDFELLLDIPDGFLSRKTAGVIGPHSSWILTDRIISVPFPWLTARMELSYTMLGI